MVNVLDCNAVAHMVVPYSKHAAFNHRVVLFKGLFANDCRCPLLINTLAIQVVIVITGGRDDINPSVGDADHLVALFLHFNRVGIAVVPNIHQHVFDFDRRVAVCVGQCSPNDRLLAKALYIFNIMVCELTELFYHLFLCVGIFIGADMDTLAAEYRFFPFYVLFP